MKPHPDCLAPRRCRCHCTTCVAARAGLFEIACSSVPVAARVLPYLNTHNETSEPARAPTSLPPEKDEMEPRSSTGSGGDLAAPSHPSKPAQVGSSDACPATARDLGTGFELHCAMTAHGPDLDHIADGMRWKDGETPVGFMGGRR
jgi:hypothetical protein